MNLRNGLMCGIAALFRPGGLRPQDRDTLRRMNDAIRHRGPDDEGFWFDEARGVGLAQRRLAIQDLSPAGAQPMLSASGRYAITFNGEIYNFKDLRAELEARSEAPDWRGHSDTEVLLALIEARGPEAALKAATGMLAFVLFDHETGAVYAARDRIGEKPLYIAEIGGAFLFASELKAFKAHPQWDGQLDHAAITGFLRHGYIAAPASLFRAAGKLPAGVLRRFAAGEPVQDTAYWDSLAEARAAKAHRFTGSFEQATDRLDALLHAAIRRQVIADVPVGAFLSGGIDSSTIASIMQAQASRPIETFSLGFREAEFDESIHAREIATHLKTSHNEISLTGQDAADLVTRMPSIYDEPFADPSQLPTVLVAGFARTKVTVSLSGDAGDELFAGYGRYHSARRKWESGLQGGVERFASGTYASMLEALLALPEAMGMDAIAGHRIGPLRLRLADQAARMGAASAIEAYERSFTVMDSAHRLMKSGIPVADPMVAEIARETGWSILDSATVLDARRYLPDDILVKVDRAAMHHSLEARVPLLDPAIIRFAWSLPDELKTWRKERKALLKAVLGRYVPRALWDRPKQGFGIPAAAWLRGPFRRLGEDLLSRQSLERQGLLETDLVRAIWEDFLAGGQRRVNLVWTLFVLQLYLAAEQSQAPSTFL
jgi:asparagine synthase (glutamine-hydrolysing)